MESYLLVLLCVINLVYCNTYNCSLTTTPRHRCNCEYDFFQVCTGINSTQCILSCISDEEYLDKCVNGEITGDVTKNDTLECSYETTAECSFPGIQFPCIETMFCSEKRTCPIDTSFVACPCSARGACEQFGDHIMNDTDFIIFIESTYYCESCDQVNISLIIQRCPTQSMNMNKGLMNLFGDIQCFHHDEWELKCIEGYTARVEVFQINENCINSSLLINALCPTNHSFVCNITSNASVCINNNDIFNLCSENQISYEPCEPFFFSLTTGLVVPPSPSITPFFPIPPVPPLLPVPSIPSLNGVNCSELILDWPQGDCPNSFNRSCCFINQTSLCATSPSLLNDCLNLNCRPGKCVIKKSPTTPTVEILEEISDGIIALIVLISIFLVFIVGIFITMRIRNARRQGFTSIG